MKVKRKYANSEAFLLADFIAEKEASGLSKKSIQNYEKVHARYVHEIGKPLSKKSINEWIHLMFSHKMNPISINFYINQIRVFAYWLMSKGYLERFEIKKLKTQEPPVRIVSDEDISVLLERPSYKSKFGYYRSWAIISFILGTGARASTIMNLKVEDIDFASKEIRYTHLKNKRSAIVPLSNSLEKVLRIYMSAWELGTGYLFPDVHGGQLTLTALEQSLRVYCNEKKVKFLGAHAFRHTFAKKYIVNGGNAFVLQRLLTHTDLAMTKKYVYLFSSDLKKGFDDMCPLDSYQKQSWSVRRKSN